MTSLGGAWRRARDLIRRPAVAVAILLAVFFLARYAHVGGFGWYEDDLTILPRAAEMTPGQLLGFVGAYIGGLHGHARPLSDSLIYVLSNLGWRIGGLRGPYLFGFLVEAANLALFYSLMRRIWGPQAAFLAGLAYALFSADTTQAFLTHSLGLQSSLTILLLCFHLYQSNRRWLSYLLAAILLFSYETPFPVFFAAPLLRWGFSRRALRSLPTHVLLLSGLLLGVFLLRQGIGEERVVELTVVGTVTTAVRQMVLGSLVSLGSYGLRIAQFLAAPRLDGLVGAGLTLILIGASLRFLGPEGEARDDLAGRGPMMSTAALIGIGAVCLLLAYPLTLTTRATAISGRETRAHLAAVIGAGMVVGGVGCAVLRGSAGRLRGWLGPAVLGVPVALLVGFGFMIQADYVAAWRLQQEFWTALLPQIQDAGEGEVILVDPVGLEDPLQIGANTWNLPRVLDQLYAIPEEWPAPPRVFRAVEDWREYLILPDGSLRINGDTVVAPEAVYTTTDWSHLIVIHTGDGVRRRLEPLMVDAVEYPLPPPGPPVLAGLPHRLLYDLLIGAGS